jgi:hypothetical protein
MDRLGALRARAVVLWVHVLEGSGTDGVDEMGSTGVMMEGGADFDQLRKRENVVVAAVVATGGRRPGLAPTTRFFSFRIVRPLSFYPAATVNKKKTKRFRAHARRGSDAWLGSSWLCRRMACVSAVGRRRRRRRRSTFGPVVTDDNRRAAARSKFVGVSGKERISLLPQSTRWCLTRLPSGPPRLPWSSEGPVSLFFSLLVPLLPISCQTRRAHARERAAATLGALIADFRWQH